ncbi:MAG: flagellar basal body P-ring protein FlgI [Ignavibacteria bacterium]|jgi:flagellar P-ring protein precursor FlgI|nr:flagellar basal body P-ring protein FlgI [Ignavibacteria bacterium]MCU7501926.1 flagellar basal body P-ring protein FlgI [Ignavibacteria bacterium]MCU7514728.1 flagellar basal body P-ring protein FlgI [Ignavibacteria bacterium]
MKIKSIIVLALLLTVFGEVHAQRIKDIAYFKGTGSEQILGYGLVVGLPGSGDTYRSVFTIQSVSSMLKRFGITVPQTDMKTRNVAAVMVTAKLNSGLKEKAEFDVTVASMGDATSLQGGVLLMTPLSALDGNVYAFAQGPISVGGYDVNTPSGGRVSKNHTLTGRIPRGGILERAIGVNSADSKTVGIMLRDPDFTTSNNIASAINSKAGSDIAKALDASEITVQVPTDKQNNMAAFLAELEGIQVQSDVTARVVLNERTGTVVAGSNVKILPVTISHGNLSINIRSYPVISQPGQLSNGSTIFFNNLVPTQQEDSTKAVAINGAATVQEVAAALNSLKVAPRDIIAIFQALKEAGALVAELVIM